VYRAQAKRSAQDDFIWMAGQELKTPAASLNAYLQMLQEKALKTDYTVTVSALEKASN